MCVCVCVCAPWQSNDLTYTSWSLAFQRKGWEGKEEEEEEEEEGLFKADAANEEDPERDRATQV